MLKAAKKSEFVKNSLISILGVGVASLIPIAIQPFLGRMYTPEQVNTQGLFLSVSAMLSIAANLRYAQAVTVAETDQEAINLVIGSLWISAVFAGVLYLPLLIFNSYIESWTGIAPPDQYWLYFVPLSTFFISSCIAWNSWLNRKKAYKAMAYNKSFRRGGEGLFQLLFGKIKLYIGYTLGSLIGDLINFIVHFFQFKKSGGSLRGSKKSEVISDLKRYRDFPKYNLMPALLDTVSLYLPFIFVNAHFDDATGGQFYQCTNVLGLPLALVSMALSQVLLQKLSENKLKGVKSTQLIIRNFVVLSIMALIGTFVLFLWGQEFFVLFLGDQWSIAGEMASWFVLAYAVKFAITPLSVIFFSHAKLKMLSYWQYARFALIGAVFFFPEFTIWEFIVYNIAADALLYAIYLIMIIRVSVSHDKTFSQP